MNKSEIQLRDELVTIGRYLENKGLAPGSSGNLSVRFEDGWLMTPTGSTLGNLDPNRISRLDCNADLVSGDPPTKESFLHMAIYRKRPDCGAVVHLHPTYTTALSCLADVDQDNVLPAITAYQVMKIGTLPLIPYSPPGDLELAKAVEEKAEQHRALLLSNHGPVVTGKDLMDAVFACEELEETAKIYFLTQSRKVRYLSAEQVGELEARFKS